MPSRIFRRQTKAPLENRRRQRGGRRCVPGQAPLLGGWIGQHHHRTICPAQLKHGARHMVDAIQAGGHLLLIDVEGEWNVHCGDRCAGLGHSRNGGYVCTYYQGASDECRTSFCHNTVPLGGAQQFNGYAIGNLNNALLAKVNGVVGGSVATGTIAPSPVGFYGYYTYTAPATLPMTGSQVTITFVSQADTTKSASAVVTLH